MHPLARHNLEAHIAGERTQDLDAQMTPLSEQPRYVVPGTPSYEGMPGASRL
jgi:hypothetical protein